MQQTYWVSDGQSDGEYLSVQFPFRAVREVGDLYPEGHWTLHGGRKEGSTTLKPIKAEDG